MTRLSNGPRKTLRSSVTGGLAFAALCAAACSSEDAGSAASGGFAGTAGGAASGGSPSGGAAGIGAASGSAGSGSDAGGTAGGTSGASAACADAPKPAAGDFYVAADGLSQGDGSEAKPWDLATAFAHPAAVKPGATIWLRGGTYKGSFTSKLTGTEAAPILVRQYPNERATLDNATGNTTALLVNGAHAWYWGFEVTNSTVEWPIDSWGVGLAGPNVKAINLIVHGHGATGLNAHHAPNGEFNGCLSYFNGRVGPNNYGYGIYTSNPSESRPVVDNLFMHNGGLYEVHGYTTSNGLVGLVFRGNVALGGVFLVGGQMLAEQPIIEDNHAYAHWGGPVRTAFDLGWSTGSTGAVVKNNYFVNGYVTISDKNKGATISNNVIVGKPLKFETTTYPNNTYYVDGQQPTGVDVFVRPNEHEPGRAHIIVHNWDSAPKVQVDLSKVLLPGEAYEIRDAEHYYGAPVIQGTFDGNPVALPMTVTDFEPVKFLNGGVESVSHSGTDFGVFVVERRCP